MSWIANRTESDEIPTIRPYVQNSWSVLPTLRDVLNLPVVAEGLPEVLSGHQNLTAPIRWVHVSDSLLAAQLLAGGELLLTTGTGWSTSPIDLRNYVSALVRVRAAGLFVELQTHFEVLPQALIDACITFDFPLIALHRKVKFVAVTEAVHSRIISEQTDALRAREELRQLFTALTLRGSPVDFIVQQLSKALRAPVVLENLRHEVIAVECEGVGDAKVLSDWEQRSRAAHRVAAHRTTQGEEHSPDEWFVVPVEARGTRWGSLIALPGKPHPAGRMAVLEQGAIALALGRLGDQGDEWLRIGHQHLLNALLGGRYSDIPGITARLEASGLPLGGRRLVGIAVADRKAALPAGTLTAAATAATQRKWRAIAGTVTEPLALRVRSFIDPGLEMKTSAPLAICLSLPSAVVLEDKDVELFVRDLASLAGVKPDSLSVGVGSIANDLNGLLRSVEEAVELLSASTAERQRGLEISHAEDRPLLRLVTMLRGDPRVQQHVQDMLRPLIEHDLAHDGDLLTILTATLAQPTNRTAAAAACHLSRSVFYQRLEHISGLLKVNLADGEVLASLQVALLAR